MRQIIHDGFHRGGHVRAGVSIGHGKDVDLVQMFLMLDDLFGASADSARKTFSINVFNFQSKYLSILYYMQVDARSGKLS